MKTKKTKFTKPFSVECSLIAIEYKIAVYNLFLIVRRSLRLFNILQQN